MKKETFDKGQTLLESKKTIEGDIQSIIDGRGKYYNSTTKEYEPNVGVVLDSITIGSLNCRKNELVNLRLDFRRDGSLEADHSFKYLSEKGRTLFEHLTSSYREAICNVLLSEEKRIQREFDDLKDE
jgi:hypothetical protein